jgi:hypothetical protein
MKVDSAVLGQISYFAQQHAREINVINENEIKSILYLGIRGLQTRETDDSQARDGDHSVDTFV